MRRDLFTLFRTFFGLSVSCNFFLKALNAQIWCQRAPMHMTLSGSDELNYIKLLCFYFHRFASIFTLWSELGKKLNWFIPECTVQGLLENGDVDESKQMPIIKNSCFAQIFNGKPISESQMSSADYRRVFVWEIMAISLSTLKLRNQNLLLF